MRRKCIVSTVGTELLLTNYGSFLQHYCLRVVLQRLGFDVSLLRLDRRCLTGIGRMLLVLRDIVKIFGYCFRLDTWNIKRCWHLMETHWTMKLFVNDFVDLVRRSDQRFTIAESDLLVLGSDQVMMVDPVAWFSNASEGKRRIVYAGSADWRFCSSDDSWAELARVELPKFAAVGVRERMGIDMCKPFVKSGLAVTHVLDPVLLVGRDVFEDVAAEKRIFIVPTLLCYFVNVSAEEQMCISKLRKIARGLGCELRIVSIQGVNPLGACRLSPRDFLAAYRDANYVLTNSYHGLLLALQFRKNFILVNQKTELGVRQSVRQTEVVEKYGISDRVLDLASTDSDVIVRKYQVYPHFDESVLDKERESSMTWLKSAAGLV